MTVCAEWTACTVILTVYIAVTASKFSKVVQNMIVKISSYMVP